MTFFFNRKFFFGSNRDDNITGTFGSDFVFGRFGNDFLSGGGGNDRLFGGFGDDTLTGGSGSDRVFGGFGNDRLVYTASQNQGSFDIYSGGRGHDTLELVLTAGEFANSELVAEIEAFEARLDGGRTGSFTFDSLGLRVRGVEKLVITISDAEDTVPTVTPLVATIDEDNSAFSFNLLDGAADADGDALSVEGLATSVETSGGRSLTLGVDYVLNGATIALTETGRSLFDDLNATSSDSVTFNFSVTDGDNVVPNTLTLTVTGVNDLATISGEMTGDVSEDETLAVTGMLSVSDIDEGEAVFQEQSNAAGQLGFFAINATGLWAYTLNNDAEAVQALGANESVVESFTILSADGTASETVQITVVGQNDIATANDDAFSGDEDNAISGNVLTNDSDTDGDDLTAILVTGPQNGSLTLNEDGSFAYVPTENFNGTDSFTYVVNDGFADSAAATVLLVVNAVNDAPDAAVTGNTATTDEDMELSGTLPAGSDVDDLSSTLTFEIVGDTPTGLLLNPDGTFTFTPEPNFNGDVTFDYLLRDPGGLASEAQTFTITVNPVNDAPIIEGVLTDAISEDEPAFSVNLLNGASDVDGDILSIQNFPTSITTTGGRLLSIGTDYDLGDDGATFTLTAAGLALFNDLAGTQSDILSASFQITDGMVSPINTLTLTIIGSNDSATIDGQIEGLVTEDQVLIAGGQVMITDPDAGEAEVVAQDNVPGQFGTFSIATDGTWSYLLNNDSMEVQALNNDDIRTDQSLVTSLDGSASQLITITINGEDEPVVNTAPVANDDIFSGDEDNTISGNVLTNDADAEDDILSAELVDGPLNGGLVFNADGSFEYTPDDNFNGTDSFTYRVNDGTLDGNIATVALTINPVNDDPTVAGPLSETVSEDDITFTIDLLEGAADVDGDMLSVSGTPVVQGDPNNGVSIMNNIATVDPSAYNSLTAGEEVIVTIEFAISDGNNGSVPQTATITITGVDEAGGDDAIAPTIEVALTTDTGASDTDGTTNDATFAGMVIDNVGATGLSATGLTSTGVQTADLSSFLQSDGSFSVSLSELESELGGTFADGFPLISFSSADAVGNVSEAAFVNLELDRSPPEVNQGPTGELNDAPSTLSIRFSEPIDFSSLSTHDFVLTNDLAETVEVTSILEVSPTEVVLNLVRSLPNDSYTLTVGADIADIAGNTVVNPATFDFSVTAVTSVTNVFPSDSTELVNVDRQIVVEFDRPIDPDTLTSQTFQVLANGEAIDGFVRVSATNLMATFFLEEGTTLPASSAIQIVLDGDAILDASGQPVDVNGDGIAGGTFQSAFSTVSLARVPNTNLVGSIFDSNRVDEDGNDIPLQGVVVSVVGLPEIFAVSDENGQFMLEDLPVGQIFIDFDATNVEAADGFSFGTVVEPIVTVAGQTVTPTGTNGEPFNIYFASLADSDAVEIVPGQETQVGVGPAGLANLREIFGDEIAEQFELLQVTIPADSLFNDDQSLATSVTVGVFEPDRIPGPLPQGFDPTVVFTVTANGAENVDSNAQLTFPNIDDLEPGTRRPIYSFDHDEGAWIQTGSAVVSDDGTVLISEGDGGINTLGWKFIGREPVTTNVQEFSFEDPQAILDAQIAEQDAIQNRAIAAADIQALALITSIADVAIPDEQLPIPGSGALLETLTNSLGAFADNLDDGDINGFGVSRGIAASTLGSSKNPIAAFIGDTAGVINDGWSIGEFLDTGFSATGQSLGLGSVSTTGNENIGVRAQQFLDAQASGVPIIPLSQQSNNVSPAPFSSSLASTGPLAPVAGLTVNAPSQITIDPDDPVVSTAQSLIDDVNASLLNDVSLEIVDLSNGLTSSILKLGRFPDTGFLEFTGGGDSNFEPFIGRISALPSNFQSLIETAEAAFVTRAQEISLAGGSVDEITAQFIIERNVYFSSIIEAINGFDGEFSQIAEEINQSVEDLGDNAFLAYAQIDSTLEFFVGISDRILVINDQIDQLVADFFQADSAGDDLQVFADIARSIAQDLEILQSDIEAAGFSNYEELRTGLIRSLEDFQAVLSDFLITSTGDLNGVFAQAILSDGTIIRDFVGPGGSFSLNGPTDNEAIIRFFDPATNLFSEDLIVFGEDNTFGVSVLSEVLTLDSDGDGIPDLGEEVIGSDPFNADTDGDGRLDGTEIIFGSNVNDGAPPPVGVIGSVPLDGNAIDIAVAANASNPAARTAYVATQTGDLAVVDVSSLTNPVLLGQFDLPGIIEEVIVDPGGSLLFTTGSAGINVVDISAPSSPFLVQTILPIGGVSTISLVDGLILAGSSGSLSLLDPNTGEILQEITFAGDVNDIVVQNGVAFAVVTVGTASQASLFSFDVSVSGITLLDGVQIPTPPVRRVQPEDLRISVEDGVAFVATGLEVTQVAPSRPLERGGFQTFDVSDPNALALISSIDTGNNQAANFQIVPNGSGLAAVAAGSLGLQIFDVSDPQNTFDLRLQLDTPGSANAVTISDGIAFVADGTAGLQIVNYLNEDATGEAPAVTVSLPNADIDDVTPGIQVVEGSNVFIDVDATDDTQVTRAVLNIDGETAQIDLSSPFAFSFVAEDSDGDGQTTVSVDVLDGAGNLASSETITLDVVPDQTAPNFLGLSVNDDTVLGGSAFTISADFDDVLDPETLAMDALRIISTVDPSMVFTANDVILVPLGVGGQSARFTFLNVPDGSFTVEFVTDGIADFAGNTVASQVVTQSIELREFTNFWTSLITGFWTDPANWSEGVVPSENDEVGLFLGAGVDAIVDQVLSASVNSVTIDGVGSLVIDADANPMPVDTTATLTAVLVTNNAEVMVGTGTLEVSEVLTNNGTLSNGGAINAQQITNNGVFNQAQGNAETSLLRNNEQVIISQNGSLNVNLVFDNQGSVQFDNGDGEIEVLENAGTFELLDGSNVDITGSIVNEGMIVISNNTSGTRLQLDSALINIVGGGTIVLNDALNLGGFAGTASLIGSGIDSFGTVSQTIVNVDNTITGTGDVGVNAELENGEDGVFQARDGDVLTITSGIVDNDGLIVAETGGRINFNSEQFFSGGIFAFRGSASIDNQSGTIVARPLGVVDLVDSAITGGTLITESDGTSSGLIRIGGSSVGATGFPSINGGVNGINASALIELDGSVRLTGEFSNTGVVFISDGSPGLFPGNEGQLFLDAFEAAILSGGGTIQLQTGTGGSGFFDTFIDTDRFEFFDDINQEGVSQAGTLIIENHTIAGSGVLGETLEEDEFGDFIFFDDEGNEFPLVVINGSYVLRDQGRISASDDAGALTINATDVFNDGILEAFGGGTLEFTGGSNVFNDGLISADGGFVEFGTASDFGFLSNDGLIEVRNDGSLLIGSNAFFRNNDFIGVETGEAIFEAAITSTSGYTISIGDGTVSILGGADGGIIDFGDGDGELRLDQTSVFDAVIEDFDVGDVITFDELGDAADVTVSVTQNGLFEQITLSESGFDVSVSIDLEPGVDLVEFEANLIVSNGVDGGVVLTFDGFDLV